MQQRSERFLTFYIDSHLCAFSISDIREVHRLPAGGASEMHTELRGEMIRLFDLRTKLGLQRLEPGPTSRLIILKTAGRHTAAQVDAIHSVIDLYSDQWESPSEADSLPFADASIFRAIANWKGETVLLLDILRIFEQRRERTIA